MRGSCHCGNVQYDADVSFDMPTFRCNCSVCTKSRSWILPMQASQLEVLEGGDFISVYTFGEGAVEHCFCRHCGIRTFGRSNGRSPMHPFAAINVSTLDLPSEDFMKFGISYLDGAHDSQEPPDITAYL